MNQDPVNQDERVAALAGEIANALSATRDRSANGNLPSDWQAVTRWLSEDPHIAGALRIELADLASPPPPTQSLVQMPDLPRDRKGRKAGVVDYWSTLLKNDPHALQVLSALVLDELGDTSTGVRSEQGMETKGRRIVAWIHEPWLRQKIAVVWMNCLIFAPALVVFLTVWGGPAKTPNNSEVGTAVLKLFIVWVLAFVPSWLYVRFLGQRAGALWSEFVIVLHRLRWDEPRYLPKPPKSSEFYREWLKQRGYLENQSRNLYRQKFNAYYGRAVSAAGLGTDFRVTVETLFPVFLCTVVLATSWVVVLWDMSFVQSPNSVWDILKFGFLGAYAFTVQSLIRRFFQSDLRPSAYAAVILRLVVVFTTLLALYQLLALWKLDPATQAVIAFVVGGFPLVGVYTLHRTAAVVLRGAVPQLTPPYPLTQIDGLNVWYEARLLEEGIEDMENLATANLVDVILHTRVPVGRLVDWVDQAYLYLHLDRMEVTQAERRRARMDPNWPPPLWRPRNRRLWLKAQQTAEGKGTARSEGASEAAAADTAASRREVHLGASLGPGARAGTETRTQLRQLGIRTATDLLKAFPPDQADPQEGVPEKPDRFCTPLPDSVDKDQIRTLVRVLDEERGLAPIWNWQSQGVVTKDPWRRPRSTVRHAANHRTS